MFPFEEAGVGESPTNTTIVLQHIDACTPLSAVEICGFDSRWDCQML